jgi:hypothetical protein
MGELLFGASVTTKQASNSSTVQGGGKRLADAGLLHAVGPTADVTTAALTTATVTTATVTTAAVNTATVSTAAVTAAMLSHSGRA